MSAKQITTQKTQALGEQMFNYTVNEQNIEWTFELKPDITDRLNYMAVEESRRCLQDLVLDMDSYVEVMNERWARRPASNERCVRKLCEKILKWQQKHLSTFSTEIQEDKKVVKEYFKKQLADEVARERITHKAKAWLVEAMATIPRGQMFEISRKYMLTYFKESKRNDWEQARPQTLRSLDDYYLVFMRDRFRPHSEQLDTDTDNLIQIDLTLTIEDRVISESFMWDVDTTNDTDIHLYTHYLLKDLLLENRETVDRMTFEGKAFTSVGMHEQTRTQLKSQLRYKSLLHKYKHYLVNFSTIEPNNQQKEYNVPIELRLINNNGDEIFSDNFEWDVLNESNNVEQFCEILLQDEKMPRRYLAELCNQLHSQIYAELNSKLNSMALIYKSILKERETPKVNSHAASQIRRNIIHSLAVTLPSHPEGYESSDPVDFNNSEMFSLISRNIDLIPEQFQSMVGYSDNRKDKDAMRVTPDKIESFARSNNLRFENNPYLSGAVLHNFDNSRLKSLYNNAVSREP